MLSPSPPQGVSATTGVAARLDRLRLPEPLAAGDVDVEEVDLPIDGRPPRRPGSSSTAVLRIACRIPSRGSRPAAARSPSRGRAPAWRRGSGPTPSRADAAGVPGVGDGLGDGQPVVPVAAQVSEVLRQADQQRARRSPASRTRSRARSRLASTSSARSSAPRRRPARTSGTRLPRPRWSDPVPAVTEVKTFANPCA